MLHFIISVPGSTNRCPGKPGAAQTVCRSSQPPQHADVHHGEVVEGALVVARGNTAELFEPVDQTLDEIATPVRGAVEVWLPTLVALARDHRPDVTPA